MKTAMQIAVESYKNDGVSFTDWFLDNYEMLLKMEKEHIIDAFEYGQINVNEDGCLTEENGAEEYYNQTYNQDRELPKDVKDMLDNL
jgi:hypothetical protein